MRVGKGKAWPRSAKTTAKRGRTKVRVLRQLPEDPERPLQGESGVEEGRELLGEGEDGARGDASRRPEELTQGVEPPAGLRRLDPEREVVVTVEALDDPLGVVGLHHAVD